VIAHGEAPEPGLQPTAAVAPTPSVEPAAKARATPAKPRATPAKPRAPRTTTPKNPTDSV